MLAIKQHKEFRFIGITIRINITKDNWQTIDEFVEYYKKMFGDDKRFKLRFAITGDYGGNNIEKYKDHLLTAEQIYHHLNNVGVYRDDELIIADILNNFQPMNLVCYAANRKGYTIGSDLSVYRCTINFNDKFNKLGKLTQDGTADIESANDYRWYIKDDHLPLECQQCFYLPCCYNAYCPLRMNFDRENRTCSIQSIKNNVGPTMEYLSKRLSFPILKFKDNGYIKEVGDDIGFG